MKKRSLILASQSPRRKQLLSTLAIPFTVSAANIDEEAVASKGQWESPCEKANMISHHKALHIFHSMKFSHKKDYIILSADTNVSYDKTIFEKPRNYDHAYEMLQALSGKTHVVNTSVVFLYCQESRIVTQKIVPCSTEVTFRSLSEADIISYLERKNYLDKAGAYGIQDESGAFVTSVHGNYQAVIGLPLAVVLDYFSELLGEHWRESFLY